MFEHTRAAAVKAAAYDQGLRSFMLGVYNRMFGCLLLTALLAYTATVPPLRDVLYTFKNGHVAGLSVLGWIVAVAPIGIILLFGLTGRMMSRAGSAFVLWSTAALFGLSSGSLVMAHTGASLAAAFACTAITFGGLSLVGYTTKKDLSGMGAGLFIALLGLIVLMIASAFIPGLNLLVSIIGIGVFAAFIAYDTQKIKLAYLPGDDNTVTANLGALDLYLDFINMFQFILNIFDND